MGENSTDKQKIPAATRRKGYEENIMPFKLGRRAQKRPRVLRI